MFLEQAQNLRSRIRSRKHGYSLHRPAGSLPRPARPHLCPHRCCAAPFLFHRQPGHRKAAPPGASLEAADDKPPSKKGVCYAGPLLEYMPAQLQRDMDIPEPTCEQIPLF
jgi:hypothetical protein